MYFEGLFIRVFPLLLFSTGKATELLPKLEAFPVGFKKAFNSDLNQTVYYYRESESKKLDMAVDVDWKRITTNNTALFHRLYYMHFDCTASYPVYLTIEGFISNQYSIHIRPRRVLPSNLFNVSGLFLFSPLFKLTTVSLKVSCRKYNDTRIQTSAYIFAHDKDSTFVSSNMSIINSQLIACPTLDPLTEVMLLKYNSTRSSCLLFVKSETGEPLDDSSLRYNPTVGFTSAQTFDGLYFCQQGNHSVEIHAQFSKNYYYPRKPFIVAFPGDTLTFICSSKYPITRIILEEEENVKAEYSQIDNHQAVSISIPEKYKSYRDSKLVLCDAGGKDYKNRSSAYLYMICQPPTLKVDNKNQKFSCGHASSMQTIRCKNSNHCMMISPCLNNPESCHDMTSENVYHKTEKHNSSESSYCFDEDCNKLSFSFFSGLLQYIDWRLAEKSELVRLDAMSFILYTNETMQFFCMAVEYLFAAPLAFQIEFHNGSSQLLQDNNDTVVISDGYEHQRRIQGFTLIGILEMMLPMDAVAIHCIAPWPNSTDVMLSTVNFETKALQKPNLGGPSESVKQEHFFIEETKQRLTCNAWGEPKPEYKWFFNDTLITSISFPELKIYLGVLKESNLEFPEISADNAETLKGRYECLATNCVGSATKMFEVDISELPDNTIPVSIAVGIVVFLLLLAVLFLVRKHWRAKRNIRDLSDTEVIEFVQGKPELLANLGFSSIEAIEFSPYNKALEIPLKDLHFKFSENNLLGSGEFAFVVRGLILSQGKCVALKIPKPSTDVTLFKSLLSEVKIMMYIGKHENVISLVGVCTEEIRSRTIYIATEICELGSFKNLLTKSKVSFVDLCNASQEIDMNMLAEIHSQNEDQMTTLDLINYARQIARGMEYLASKSVVHADLATRNVLVTSDKVAKISDFGLSKKLYKDKHYAKKSKSPLPWRWVAVESLASLTFSTKSDVWAFGVTLYEMFTLGDVPYPNEIYNCNFIQRLKDGMRRGRPEYCPQNIFSKMNQCWETNPEQRPDFTALYVYFENLYRQFTIIEEENGIAEMVTGPVACTSGLSDCSGSTQFHINTQSVNYVNSDSNVESIELEEMKQSTPLNIEGRYENMQ